jgi:sterol carrier protein 2
VLNPYSQFHDTYTLEQVVKARKVFGPLTLPQCCPTSDGAGCAVIVNEQWLAESGFSGTAVEILSQHVATDAGAALKEPTSAIALAGADMTRTAALKVFNEARVAPSQVQVVELHDCFSANELVTYDALGLASPGKAHELVRHNDTTYGGKFVVNPSGGLLSKGHPLGATGLAQCCELVWQCRNQCGKRQVPNVQHALQHNIGLGGIAVVTLYKALEKSKQDSVQAHWKNTIGYNPAVEAREIEEKDFVKVTSKKHAFLKSAL